MPIGKVHSVKKLIAQIVLLALPTAALAMYVTWNANHYFNILQNDWIRQGLYFTAGCIAALALYSYRFRFITTTLVLALLLAGAYQLLGGFTVGEFDAFFASVQFMVFAVLFSAGWITGYGFSRSRYYSVFWPVFLLCVQVVLVSKTAEIKAATLISAFAPVLAYAVYIIYTAELLRNMNNDDPRLGWFITKRMIGFAVVLAVLLLAVLSIFEQDFKAVEKEWGNAQADYDKGKGGESMTRNNRDGSISNKDQTRLTGSLNKGKRLVFVAKLDNFFEDGQTPNPLYFTAYYYTKFDTLTQAFEVDSLMPDNDLFRPNPSKIPLYFAKTDSTVINNTHATNDRKVVTAEIYKVLLSPDEYIAPSTAFFCQPIQVADEYKGQYKSAYRAKMWVSDLNSAYFIYNPAGNAMLEQFQEQRFETLRTITSYAGVDKQFMNYYTFMPSNEEYDSLRRLAYTITKDAQTPVDKMIAIRDYFLSLDEFGQPLYKYSDNPGIPGLPSASKLNYFLFENRKGYCAYFAGATLFMLRALGIPSRVAAGFLTIDRSTKNPGWYWFYEDQAHAWVQVFFPGYGWIDFDTTVPDVNTQQAPQPDETPPLNMQDAYFVADGTVTDIDTMAKRIRLDVTRVLFHDDNYESSTAKNIQLDVSIARVSRDSGDVPLGTISKGMHITAASFAEALKDLKADDNDSMASVLEIVPDPVPVDYIRIIDPESAARKQQAEKTTEQKPIDWIRVLWLSLLVLGIAFALVLATPWAIWRYYVAAASRGTGDRSKAFAIHRATMYYLHQLGYGRTGKGPQEYAAETDRAFGTNFSRFSTIYQKLKYSSLPLTAQEKEIMDNFFTPFVTAVRAQVPLKTRIAKFVNIYTTIAWYSQRKIS